MNLNEVQTVYYLLNAIELTAVKLGAKESQELTLFVSYKSKIMTADFIPSDSLSEIMVEGFDTDFQIKKRAIYNCLPSELLTIWQKENSRTAYSSPKIFINPNLLLSHIIEFVNTRSKKSGFKKPVTNLVKNVHFIESGLKFDSMLLEDEGFEILSLQVK